MDIYIYTDESGVFDRIHNQFFVYGGILFLSFDEKASYRYNTYYEPILPNLEDVTVKYCDSSNTTLIRSADIIANRIYYFAQYEPGSLKQDKNFFITLLP